MMNRANLLVILATGITFFSCNKVETPIQAPSSSASVNDTVRKILVEDFTGHLCINCPASARLIDSLDNLYPGQIIPMAVHAGFFAEPCTSQNLPLSAPAGSFSEDLTTPLEDADYNSIFGTYSWPNPVEMVNRNGSYATQQPVYPAALADSINALLQAPISAYIKIHPSYITLSHQLHLTVSGILYDTLSGNYNLAVYLVENNIHGWQINPFFPSPHYDSAYVFDRVFRGSVNNPGHLYGDQVLSGVSVPGTLINYNMPSTFTVNAAYNASNCKLVAILYNAATYNVVQADMVDLM